MKRKRAKTEGKEGVVEKGTYDLNTPLWNKYYQQVRKSIRFPRYYKRALNW